MSATINIDKLVEDFILSTYGFRKSTYGHDMMFRKGCKYDHEKMNGMDLVTEIKLIFDYDSLKTFNLVTRWAHATYPDIILFEFWKQSKTLFDNLPDYMRLNIQKYDFPELYQDFYFETVDS